MTPVASEILASRGVLSGLRLGLLRALLGQVLFALTNLHRRQCNRKAMYFEVYNTA
jgi:hypothetical protein